MSDKKENRTKVDELREALEKRRKAEAVGGGEGVKSESLPQEKTAQAEELEELAKQLAAAEEEAKSHYDKFLRLMAELDNFRKRSEKEKRELIQYGNQKLVADLLPALDGMDQVLHHLPLNASSALLDFVSGVELVSRQFLDVLAKYGLAEIRAEGEKFNPEFHEAVAHIPSDSVETEYVIEVHRRGYTLNGRVIRPSMVTVSCGANLPEAA